MTSMSHFSSFKNIEAHREKQIAKLTEFSGLCPKLVAGILQYVKCLRKDMNREEIDELIFFAQMVKQFKITSRSMLRCMYDANKKPKTSYMSVEEMARCVCTFLSPNDDIKVDFVFHVYDINGDKQISWAELYNLLKYCILDTDDVDTIDESVRDLVDIVRSVVDTDKDGNVDISEFRTMVKRDVLFLELLGQCLPSERQCQKFKKKIEGKSALQVKVMFENERYISLNEPIMPKKDSLYPFMLDLP